MVRVINQETFDDVVKENIEDFEMSPEEAVNDAVAQFEAQGVDLSNIIKDLALTSKEDHTVVTLVRNLQNNLGNVGGNEEFNIHIQKLTEECSKGIAYKIRAGKEGCYSLLLRCYDSSDNDETRINILKALIALMEGQPDLLDDVGVKTMKKNISTSTNKEIVISTLKWMSHCCVKHETNRQKLFAADVITDLKSLLATENESAVLCEILSLMRKMVLDDDIRVQFGKAHDHAKEIAVQTVTKLTRMLGEKISDRQLTSQLLQTIASVLVRHEFCQMVSDAGGCQTIFQVLTDYYEDVTVINQGFKLVKALSGNDEVKRNLVNSGICPILTSLMFRHMSNPVSCSLCLACISLISLREPTHSAALFDNGVADAIVDAMKRYPNDAGVQKNACWSIRNLVARCRENNSKLLDLGVEALLKESMMKFGNEFGFDVKSALRDLGCDVKLDEQWKGTGIQMSND